MFSWGAALVFVLSTCETTSGAPASAPTSQKPNGFLQKIDQLSFGAMACLVSKDGTVFDNPKSGYLVVSSASRGTVILENPKRKLYFNCSDEGGALKNRFSFMLYRQLSMPFLPPKKWERERSTTFHGHPTTIYRGIVSPSKGLFDGVEFWVAQDISRRRQRSSTSRSTDGHS